jgi:hypothetical protein
MNQSKNAFIYASASPVLTSHGISDAEKNGNFINKKGLTNYIKEGL